TPRRSSPDRAGRTGRSSLIPFTQGRLSFESSPVPAAGSVAAPNVIAAAEGVEAAVDEDDLSGHPGVRGGDEEGVHRRDVLGIGGAGAGRVDGRCGLPPAFLGAAVRL